MIKREEGFSCFACSIEKIAFTVSQEETTFWFGNQVRKTRSERQCNLMKPFMELSGSSATVMC
jgi:hypothetical protein